ncbi:hypothetical protein PAXRUDRAFT_824590 [Paxillus rubicundulus Ve08.2h10]|uniref:Uncharacterized protein n=1 Tax=Paxillus rubicundulus Ve08.2h10 TaxID=930991 RepID=A0A0D0DU74_9AGAM|nr:hypothetical protein PAXRUDRAFT_824590 [Paxillus rubicundulus Ve08.2h10]
MTNMQEGISEFVIKRKRKRLCRREEDATTNAFLPFSTPQMVDTEEVVSLHSDLIPEIAILTEPDSSLEFPTHTNVNPEPPVDWFQNSLTVEEFLRRSIRKPTRTQKKKRLISSLSGWDARASPPTHVYKRAVESQTQLVGAIVKQPKQPKRQNKAVRMSETLFRAAVLAHGDPLDSLTHTSAGSCARRPLEFVPFNKFTTSLPSFVLPSQPAESLEADPVKIAGLDTLTSAASSLLKLKTSRKPKTNAHRKFSDTRRPLDFVPLREAEVAYSIKFQ